ncbi:MAG: VTT domain-containing protein [Microbacteriaceae bacterium]|nr:VTT domain-containing protein [Microbacteriaceae bacterium]
MPAPAALIPFLDPIGIINAAGPWVLLVVCLIIFAETGLLIGFILPGDTLLLAMGVMTFVSTMGMAGGDGITEEITTTTGIPIWVVCLAIGLAAFAGGEVGYLIGHKGGPAIFEKKESGLFSIKNVERTSAFFKRFGGWAIILARFVPVVRTVAPLLAGVGHMPYRRYTLYNLIGALIWGAGLTYIGYLIGYIPWLRDFIIEYIDIVLLAVVLVILIPTIWHFVQGRIKARRAGNAVASAAEVESLVVDLSDHDKQE